MNENIDLTKILKNCPKGWKFYSSIHGELLFSCMYLSSSASKITFIEPNKTSMFDGSPISVDYYRDGKYFPNQGECVLFPSKDQRDWSKFTAPWYKKERFDPNTLKPFDRVLVFDNIDKVWSCDFYSHKVNEQECFNPEFPYICVGNTTDRIIPYNEDTKHLIGTTDEVPEFYKYWEE